jgi:hypothetical protein
MEMEKQIQTWADVFNYLCNGKETQDLKIGMSEVSVQQHQ